MQLDAISSTFFIAGLISRIPGLVVDRMGTRFSMSLGGTAGVVFTMIYWAVARQFVHLACVVLTLSILAVAICLSCGLIIGSIFKLAIMCGGDTTKGSAVGVAKGFVGLGAGVYATIFQALRTADESALDCVPHCRRWSCCPQKRKRLRNSSKLKQRPCTFERSMFPCSFWVW